VPGTPLTYRVRGQGPFKPVEKFIASAQIHLQERYEHYTRLCHNTADTAWEKRWYERMCDDITAALRTLASPHIDREILSEITHKVYGGTSNYPPDMERYAQGMRLFADIEFRQEPYPSVEQLVQTPPANAFCRVTGVGNPFLKEQTTPVPQSDERTRQAILTVHQHRHVERLARQNTPEHERPSAAPENQPTTRQGVKPVQEKIISLFTKQPRHKKPKDEEDWQN
jgi:hypothetical protein